MLCKISTNATAEFNNRCIFKDMNFYGHEFFRQLALGLLSYPVVRIINYMIFFLSKFPFPSSSFQGFEEQLFRNSRKSTRKKQRDGVYILLRCRSQDWDIFFEIFLIFPEQWIILSFLIFFVKLFHCSFFLFEAIKILLFYICQFIKSKSLRYY